MSLVLFLTATCFSQPQQYAPCPEEDYPSNGYNCIDSETEDYYEIEVCFDDLDDPCDDETCCFTAYYCIRYISSADRFDVQLWTLDQEYEDDCYICGREQYLYITQEFHKAIIEKHAIEFGLEDQTTYNNHLVLKAACWFEYSGYQSVCEYLGCCYKVYNFTIDDNTPPKITNYEYNGQAYYGSSTGDCTDEDCTKRCEGVGYLNMFPTHYKKPITDNNIEFEEILEIGPNPANDLISILFRSPQPGKAVAMLYDFTGKEAMRKVIETEKKTGQLKMNLSDYTSGIYYLIVHVGNKTYRRKILIVK